MADGGPSQSGASTAPGHGGHPAPVAQLLDPQLLNPYQGPAAMQPDPSLLAVQEGFRLDQAPDPPGLLSEMLSDTVSHPLLAVPYQQRLQFQHHPGRQHQSYQQERQHQLQPFATIMSSYSAGAMLAFGAGPHVATAGVTGGGAYGAAAAPRPVMPGPIPWPMPRAPTPLPLAPPALGPAAGGAAALGAGSASLVGGQLPSRQEYYPTVYERIWSALRSGEPPLREWPARDPTAPSQMVWAAPRIKNGGMGNVTAASGSTLRSGARAGEAAGGLLPPAAGRLVLEAKGSLRGNPHWPENPPVSRFYIAADGELSEQDAAVAMGAPAGTALKEVSLKCGRRVWYYGDAYLAVVEATAAAAIAAGADVGIAGAAAAAAPMGGKRRVAVEAGAGEACRAGTSPKTSSSEPPPEPAPTSLERRGRQWALAVSANCVYDFLEAVAHANFEVLEELLPLLPQLEGGGVNWERVRGGVEQLSPLHVAVQYFRTWPPEADVKASGLPDTYTVPHMPIEVRLRLVHWLLHHSTPPPTSAPPPPPPPSPPSAATRRQQLRSQVSSGGGGGSAGGGEGGRRGGAARGGAGAALQASGPADAAHTQQRTGGRSVLVMARNARRSVPLLTLMRWADCDGQEWRPLVAELCAHMAFDDYSEADSKKGWFPHHNASSLGSRPGSADAAAATGAGPSSSGAGSAQQARPEQHPPGSRGCLEELLQQLLRMAGEKLEAAAAAAAAGGSSGSCSDAKRRRKARADAALPVPAPGATLPAAGGSAGPPWAPGWEQDRNPTRWQGQGQDQALQAHPTWLQGYSPPGPQGSWPAASAPLTPAQMVSNLLFHLHSPKYDGRLLEQLAAAKGLHVEPAVETAPSRAFAMLTLSRNLLARRQAAEATAARQAAAAGEQDADGAAASGGAATGSGERSAAASGALEEASRGRACGGGGRGGVRVAGLGAGRRRRGGAGRAGRRDESGGVDSQGSDDEGADSRWAG